MGLMIVAGLVAGVAIPVFGLWLRYRRAMRVARARVAAVQRHVVSTQFGAVEYAERGAGDPVLVVHGIFQDCLGGLLSVRDMFPDRRVIAPSRFGYLGSSLPPGATPAMQADAFAALLDALDIREIDVVGFSAGATSALQLALRHPHRVKHLALLVANLPGSPTTMVQPRWTERIDRQFVMWALWTLAPSKVARLVAAVPRDFDMSLHTGTVNEFIDSLFPMSAPGYNFDLFVSNADVDNYPLEAIQVPTLVAHTKDDQLASHEASRRAAERIPGARFVSVESGGHLMLGLQDEDRQALGDFLAESPRRPPSSRPELTYSASS